MEGSTLLCRVAVSGQHKQSRDIAHFVLTAYVGWLSCALLCCMHSNTHVNSLCPEICRRKHGRPSTSLTLLPHGCAAIGSRQTPRLTRLMAKELPLIASTTAAVVGMAAACKQQRHAKLPATTPCLIINTTGEAARTRLPQWFPAPFCATPTASNRSLTAYCL